MATRQKVVKIDSCFIDGIKGVVSHIEISLSPGIPTFDIIGLCDSSIRESRGRIQAAIRSTGFNMPKGHITISISPAYLRKSGSFFDLPIALGVLWVSGQIPIAPESRIYAEGELALNGEVKDAPGACIRLTEAMRGDYDYRFIPLAEEKSANLTGFEGMIAESLREVCDSLGFAGYRKQLFNTPVFTDEMEGMDPLALVGQEKALRALEIAAAGFHNILMIGSPGSGKTMAGRMLNSLMPAMSNKEARDVFAIYDVSGNISDDQKLRRPFRYVHHSISPSKLLGNGSAKNPGELLLANNGILFCDELPEFHSSVIDMMRQPMEDHYLTMLRNGKSETIPASFMFVGAGNPCKCGLYLDDPKKCKCTDNSRRNYLKKLSGPFLDRMDLYAEMRSLSSEELKLLCNSHTISDEGKSIREHINEAWHIQSERYSWDKADKRTFNGNCDSINLDLLRVDKKTHEYSIELADKLHVSGRSYMKLLKVARTIADLSGNMDVSSENVAEAASYRVRINGGV